MNDNPLDSLLDEMMASLSQDSREAMLRRVNAERLIKLLAGQMIDQHVAERIRIIPDTRLSEQEAADFLIQIDDYDLRAILLDAPDGKPVVTVKNVGDWIVLLESNPSTIALIVVWANDDLSAIPFSMRRLKAILETPDQIDKVLNSIKPFGQIISEIIQRQTKDWKIPEIQKSETTSAGRDLYSIFSEKIIRSIDTEANRHYLIKERVKAAQEFPYESEKHTILSILQEALDGKSADELQKHLINIPRRGEK
jgi:hypothetical protein